MINETNAMPTALHIKRSRLYICAAIAQDLLLSEFARPMNEQNFENLNLFVNITVDLALNEVEIEKKLEKIFLCANDMNVLSDYYYLVANVLRFKVSFSKEKKEDFIIKNVSYIVVDAKSSRKSGD